MEEYEHHYIHRKVTSFCNKYKRIEVLSAKNEDNIKTRPATTEFDLICIESFYADKLFNNKFSIQYDKIDSRLRLV